MMAKYALLFIGKPSKAPSHTDTNASWDAWVDVLKIKNIYVGGSAFTPEGVRLTDNKTDDLAVNENSVGGYVVLEAESMDAAVYIAKSSPHATWGGLVEVRYCRDL